MAKEYKEYPQQVNRDPYKISGGYKISDRITINKAYNAPTTGAIVQSIIKRSNYIYYIDPITGKRTARYNVNDPNHKAYYQSGLNSDVFTANDTDELHPDVASDYFRGVNEKVIEADDIEWRPFFLGSSKQLTSPNYSKCFTVKYYIDKYVHQFNGSAGVNEFNEMMGGSQNVFYLKNGKYYIYTFDTTTLTDSIGATVSYPSDFTYLSSDFIYNTNNIDTSDINKEYEDILLYKEDGTYYGSDNNFPLRDTDDLIYIISKLYDKEINPDPNVKSEYTNIIKINYDVLKTLRDAKQLSPSSYYHIIDYETVIGEENENLQAVSINKFNVIVCSLSNDKVSSKAYAINCDDPDYLENSKLNLWQIDYDIDNNTELYDWAVNKIDNNKPKSIYIGGQYFYATYKDGYYYWTIDGDESLTPTIEISGSNDKYIDGYVTTVSFEEIELDIEHCVAYRITTDNNISTIATQIEYAIRPSVGKGVIYNMVDEFGNRAPYDFKNIKIKNYVTGKYEFTFGGTEITAIEKETGLEPPAPQITTEYTYSTKDESITGECYGNVILSNIVNGKYIIPLITVGSHSHNNVFGYNCYNIVLGSYASCNSFDICCSNINACVSNETVGTLYMKHCTFGKAVTNINYNTPYTKNWIIESGVNNINLEYQETIQADKFIKNVKVSLGVQGEENNAKIIYVPTDVPSITFVPANNRTYTV